MCAINPKHKKRFLLDVYTSLDITEEDFLNIVTLGALAAELTLNSKSATKLRWHIKETDQEAD